eukprot:scaffold130_cov185-Alexandrium_tamarense.AAC.10
MPSGAVSPRYVLLSTSFYPMEAEAIHQKINSIEVGGLFVHITPLIKSHRYTPNLRNVPSTQPVSLEHRVYLATAPSPSSWFKVESLGEREMGEPPIHHRSRW